MFGREINNKTAAYLLIGLSVLVGVVHTLHPVTLSPPDAGERWHVALITAFFAWLITKGNRSARIGVGVGFLLFAAINLLIVLAYVRDFSRNSLEICFWTAVLGTLGYLFLFSPGIRYFEEKSQIQQLSAL